MIVYRSQARVVETADWMGIVRGAAGAQADGPPYNLLIKYGELEAGVADADESASPVLRRAAVALGRLFCDRTEQTRTAFLSAFEEVENLRLPRSIEVCTPEGYAFYALYPEMYVEPAREFVRDCRPRNVVVIGIRSIGTGLSAVVAGVLEAMGCQVESHTVRPRGHPFDRVVDLPAGISKDADWYAIVDEGPGLSGSSFASVASLFPEEKVVLFPSWEGDPSRFVNDRARFMWPRYRKYHSSHRPSFVTGRDLSAGQWRDLSMSQVAVQPQHESRKYLDGSTLFKFSGLGSYGRDKFERACVLAEAGYSPRPQWFVEGFIAFDFVPASPCTQYSLDRLAAYIAFRRNTFPARRSIEFDQMVEMIAFNAGVDLSEFRSEFNDRPACAIDGRMLPHEWITTGSGWLKTDSVDHCCNHFFPGYADVAWDLAGTCVEFQLSPEERSSLIGKYQSLTADCVSDGLIHFYEVAYLAFRLGYVSLAAQSTSGTPEEHRFQELETTYKGQLEAALETHRVLA